MNRVSGGSLLAKRRRRQSSRVAQPLVLVFALEAEEALAWATRVAWWRSLRRSGHYLLQADMSLKEAIAACGGVRALYTRVLKR